MDSEIVSSAAREWYKTVDQMGEWLLIGSIAAMSLPAGPGLFSLATLLWFFTIRPQNKPHPLLRQMEQLRHKHHRTAEEDADLHELMVHFRPKKGYQHYLPAFAGLYFWLFAALYLGLLKGLLLKAWY